jgi:hypothetical protein
MSKWANVSGQLLMVTAQIYGNTYRRRMTDHNMLIFVQLVPNQKTRQQLIEQFDCRDNKFDQKSEETTVVVKLFFKSLTRQRDFPSLPFFQRSECGYQASF